MLDLQKTIDAAIAAHPSDANFIRKRLPDMIREVEARDIEPGDFFYIETGGLHVQRIHYTDAGLDGVEVFINVTKYADVDE